jgi:hypothetical protein
MFESSTISIISKVTVETIIKTTKVVIKSIEKEFVTKVATEVATKLIEEEIVSNEEKNNWKSISNNVALSIETEATEAIETTNANERDRNDNKRINNELKLRWRFKLKFKFKHKITKRSRIAHRWIAKCRDLVFVSFLDTRFANELINLIAKESRSFRVTIES